MLNKKLTLSLLFSSLFLFPIVFAGPLFDNLGAYFSSGGIVDVYYQYQGFIEFLIYITIFISLIQGVFKDRFGDKETKLIAIAMGVALSFGLAQYFPGLTERLGPIAFLIFIALFWYLVFASLKDGFENQWHAMAAAYLLSFIILWILDPTGETKSLINNISGLEWVSDILIVLAIISVILIGLEIKKRYFNNG
jgi:hypothetical protein